MFDETSTQEEVFEGSTKGIVDSLLEGVNCSVFAYGATGAGKTHTMLGGQDHPGVIFLTMMELYRKIYEQKEEICCEVTVSYLEIYNEQIKDLLIPSGPLSMRDDRGTLVVQGLSLHKPRNAEELLGMLELGNQNRTQHPTEANATSSRSHAVFQVYVHRKPRTTGIQTQVSMAKLSLIDLAGSERATVTANRGERLREGANINRSLLALGNCINALASNKGKSVFVPYRDSKLTRLLKDSLGGTCQTVMIANVSPSGLSYEDSYNTLKYADRAKQIKTKVVRNVLTVDYHMSRYKTVVEELQREIAELKTRLTQQGPLKSQFDKTEAACLHGVVGAVFSERCELRKGLAVLDAQERQLNWKIRSKENYIRRLESLGAGPDKMDQAQSWLELLETQVRQREEERRALHDKLQANQEEIVQVQQEVSTSVDKQKDPFALRQYITMVMEAEKARTENAQNWVQVKSLMRFMKQQQAESDRQEKTVCSLLAFIRLAFPLFAGNAHLLNEYKELLRHVRCERGVAWADESCDTTSCHDNTLQTSVLSPPPNPTHSENEPIRLSSVEPPTEADCSEPLPVPVTIPSGTAVKSPPPPSSLPPPSTAVTPQPHTPAPPTLTGSSTRPLTTPTSSAVARLLGSVQTLGSSIRKVKPLPPPPQVPSFQEYLRQQSAQRTPSACVPMATGSNRKFSALSHLSGVTPSCNTGHTPSHLSGHAPSYLSGHTPSFTRTVGRLAFDDNFTSPTPQPLPPVTHSRMCDTTFTVTSPQSTVSTGCSDTPSRGSSCVSHHLRGLPLGAPLSNATNHTDNRSERSPCLSTWASLCARLQAT